MVGVVVEAGFTKGTGRPGGARLVAIHVVEDLKVGLKVLGSRYGMGFCSVEVGFLENVV